MSLGNLFSSLAPVAAGFMTGGSSLAFAPLLAGAATGAGIAALRDEDPLMGAVTGGIGGYGGGELGKAAAGVGGVNTLANPSKEQMASNALMGGSRVPSAAAAPTYSATTAAKNLFTNPGGVISNLGGGDMTKGALKAGAVGLPAVAGAMVPDMPKTTGEMNQMKYDPNRRLNLNQPTGLRLLQEGGYLETGVGDGVSDEIPGSIDGEQPVLLSENEFVIPADVVSGLGNGSSDAGAEQLYAMMDRVRKARTGTEKMGKEVTAERLMPA
jgi:hypothetical protein